MKNKIKNKETESNIESVTSKGVMDKLIEINELIELLGYVDERSITSWCKKNKVPLIHIGKKTYTVNNFIDMFISQKLEAYVNSTYKDPDSILKAIREDNKEELTKLVNAPLEKKALTKKIMLNSKAADDFLRQLKAA
jgi:hypothetical protein